MSGVPGQTFLKDRPRDTRTPKRFGLPVRPRPEHKLGTAEGKRMEKSASAFRRAQQVLKDLTLQTPKFNFDKGRPIGGSPYSNFPLVGGVGEANSLFSSEPVTRREAESAFNFVTKCLPSTLEGWRKTPPLHKQDGMLLQRRNNPALWRKMVTLRCILRPLLEVVRSSIEERRWSSSSERLPHKGKGGSDTVSSDLYDLSQYLSTNRKIRDPDGY